MEEDAQTVGGRRMDVDDEDRESTSSAGGGSEFSADGEGEAGAGVMEATRVHARAFDTEEARQAEALRFKEAGNEHFKGGRFTEAISDYTRSLEAVETAAVLGNRAQAYLKLEDFGYAIADAERALQLDKTYVKAHYRRGSALMALGKYKAARKDFRAVTQLLPHDADARSRLDECTKAVQRQAFEEAIATEATATIWERVDFARLEVEPGYDGPRLPPMARPLPRGVPSASSSAATAAAASAAASAAAAAAAAASSSSSSAVVDGEGVAPPADTRSVQDAFEEDMRRPTSEPSEWGVSVDFCRALMRHHREQKRLSPRYAYELLLRAFHYFRSLPSLIRPELTPSSSSSSSSSSAASEKGAGGGHRFTIVGDTHGQYYDLLHIFEGSVAGEPSPANPFLFNGDFVDRGPFSVEVILTLLSWKLCFPRWFHMLRGNHETKNMGRMYGFEGEVLHKYDSKCMEMFLDVFRALPLAAVVGGKVMVVHGGIFERDGVTLRDVEAIERFREPPEGGGDMSDILWADPQPNLGRGPSKRGVGKSFGPDITRAFLRLNNLSLLVRSHEVKDEGYVVEHDGLCITIFSAPNYCDQMGNKGAVLRLDQHCSPSFVQYSESPHPPARPMQYASGMMRLMG